MTDDEVVILIYFRLCKCQIVKQKNLNKIVHSRVIS